MPGRPRGVNIVGLRRAGIKSSEIRNLKAAYQVLLRSGLPLQSALVRLTELDDPLVYELIDFIRASTRGFCHEEGKAQRPKS